MQISSVFIDRPVATSLLAVALLILSWMSYLALPVASLPQVDFPTIVVKTQLPGANPQTMRTLVTAPLERQLGQIPSLTNMTSTNWFGLSEVTLQFELSRDIDGAAQDVNSAISVATASMPRGLSLQPTYAKVNPADIPIVTLAFSSPTIPLRELTDIADTVIIQRMSEVSGVGSVTLIGGRRPAIRIRVRLELALSLGISLEDIRSAVSAANVVAPKGALHGPASSYTIWLNDEMASADQFGEIAVAQRNGTPVRLRDVAEVIDGVENELTGAWFKQRPAVVMQIRRQPGANTIQTVTHIKAELRKLASILPAAAQLEVAHDRTDTIRASIGEVQLTLAISTLLVVLVVLLFLRSWSSIFIAGITLPLSLAGTFAVMWLCGFSLNNLTLMALTIGTGFVVDDIIVMIENIARHQESGDGELAAHRGASEIGFTVVSLTVSLLAVFIPMMFMTGIVGRMFREFALTLAILVIISAVVALTLTPMLCAKLMRSGKGHHSAASERQHTFYTKSLAVVLRWPVLTLLVLVSTIAWSVLFYVGMNKAFLPAQDIGLIEVTLKTDAGASNVQVARTQGRAAEIIAKLADVNSVVSTMGPGSGSPAGNSVTLTVVLKPQGQRTKSSVAVSREIEAALSDIPGMLALPTPLEDVQVSTRSGLAKYAYTIVGQTEPEVRRWGVSLSGELRRRPQFRHVQSIEEDEGQSSRVVVDRARAGQFGVSQQLIGELLNDAFSQRQIGTLYGQANQYRVVLEFMHDLDADPLVLQRIRIPGTAQAPSLSIAETGTAAQIPLSAVAAIEKSAMPLAISHRNQFPAFTISFNASDGYSLDRILSEIESARIAVGMSDDLTGTFSGDAAEFQASMRSQPLLILAAVVSIYIVLGTLYESFIHPITILSTLPSAGLGALLALQMSGHELTIIGVIGIILLLGIVKKNAILMIDFAIQQQRQKQVSPEAAIVEACRLRLRPITMTTLAALFGALPLVLSSGPGSEFRVPLGMSIIGGLIISQFLTLYTTPVIYLLLERGRLTFGRSDARP